jgi:hypothetical protein
MLRALTLPTNCVPYGTTSELFTSVRQAFADHGFPEAVAVPASFFVLASWFAEILPAAPCFSITGSRPESILLLQLLACLVRHPLTLGEIGRSALRSLPPNLQLTLLTEGEELSESLLRLLSVSNRRGANILWKGELRNIFARRPCIMGKSPTPVFPATTSSKLTLPHLWADFRFSIRKVSARSPANSKAACSHTASGTSKRCTAQSSISPDSPPESGSFRGSWGPRLWTPRSFKQTLLRCSKIARTKRPRVVGSICAA